MDAEAAWNLFAATGLPEAYDLYAELKERPVNKEEPTPGA